ncbi:N-acetylglucosaminyl-phosphatidylinositol de-N-acetylase isoform X2 [Osmerus mordax]|uniref:N-acetylglucosaminyl-phosphatidylinositol de-N-acetylase isoform X2 n=1 Tax=Osmerus mordax TaxID=8014 RepID=UPI0035103A27
MDILFAVFIVVSSYFILIKCIYNRCRSSFAKSCKHLMTFLSCREKSPLDSQASDFAVDVRALIVTAHPDDECMFFAPIILRLVEMKIPVQLLCLSKGNFYNQGSYRQEELYESCGVLGLPASNICILDHKELPDSPKVEWNTSLTSSLILKHITEHSINMVLTFDGRGVSGHANHTAIHKAVSYLASAGKLRDDCRVLSLLTVGMLRKYLSFLDIPISWLLPSQLCCIIGSQGYQQAKVSLGPCYVTAPNSCGFVTCTFCSRATCLSTHSTSSHKNQNVKIY